MSDWGSSSCGPHTFYFYFLLYFSWVLVAHFLSFAFLLFSFCHYEHNMARRFWSWPQNRFLMRLVTERALLGWLLPPISHHTLPLLENLSCLFFSISLSCSLMGLNRRENSSNLLPQSDENYIKVPTGSSSRSSSGEGRWWWGEGSTRAWFPIHRLSILHRNCTLVSSTDFSVVDLTMIRDV